jgi:hypothetical protein
MAGTAWFFCLRHREVEPGPGCRSAERLGPYPDQATAARALDIARERTRAEDEADRRWAEGD